MTVAGGRDGAGAWLRVSDNGPGIPTFGRVFRRFRRGELEQAAGRSGSGLGLSIMQRIARLHDADVEPGRGLGDTGLRGHRAIPLGLSGVSAGPRLPDRSPTDCALRRRYRRPAFSRGMAPTLRVCSRMT
jgi:hypothetical protein